MTADLLPHATPDTHPHTRPIVLPVALPSALPTVLPDGLPDTSVVVELGPDWAGLQAFAASAAGIVLAGPVVGHAVAGPTGTITGTGAAAAVLFIGAHLMCRTRTRRLDRPTSTRLGQTGPAATGSAPTGSAPTGSAATGSAGSGAAGSGAAGSGPAGWAWCCQTCDAVSIETSTPAEALALAAVHDGLHHGRPTARITRAALTRAPA